MVIIRPCCKFYNKVLTPSLLTRCLERTQLLKGDPVPLLGDWNSSSVTYIQEDITSDNIYLAVQGNALIQINATSNTTVVLAGSINEEGFKNEISTAARFEWIESFLQEKDGNTILVADSGNRCIRMLDKKTLNVSTYSGFCSAYLDHQKTVTNGKFSEATYLYPYDMGQIHNIIVLTDENHLRALNTTQRTVWTEYSSIDRNARAVNLNRIGINERNGKIYITCVDSILVFSSKVGKVKFLQEIQAKFILNWVADLEGVAILSDSLLLVTSGLSSQIMGLFTLDLLSARMRNVCISATKPPNIQMGTCRYMTYGTYISKTKEHQLLISGDPVKNVLSHIGVDIVQLNGKCKQCSQKVH